ncbi:MAG: putative Histidine kinase [Actinomycetia bacterium]|nr:putative Histidine kinase [Actinomycetes bacterium]
MIDAPGPMTASPSAAATAAGPGVPPAGSGRPRHQLRTRLLIAMVAISAGVLVMSLLLGAGLARRAADSQAKSDLERKMPELTVSIEQLRDQLAARSATLQGNGIRLRRLLTAALDISDGAIVGVTDNGQITTGRSLLNGKKVPAASVPQTGADNTPLTHLPAGMDLGDLDTGTLLKGQRQTGKDGNVVFVAQPLAKTGDITPVVVISQAVSTRPFGRSGGAFLFAGALAFLVSLVASYLLARRLTRPIGVMSDTTARLAAGDLSARVPLDPDHDDELSRLGRALNGMAAQLESSRGNERAFLLSISHDLRTPLTSIRGYAEAIADGAVDDPESRARAAGVITAEAQRLERLVADLLDLARLDAHQFSLTLRPVDAAEVVSTAVTAFMPSAAELGISLELDASIGAPADVDPERLAQIIANLTENALKYAATKVLVQVVSRGRDLLVSVDDDGAGIAPADLPHVFERLYTARDVPGRKVGTGLGLAIVRELAQAMGGTVRVDALTGAGTRFTVTLPVLVSPPGS